MRRTCLFFVMGLVVCYALVGVAAAQESQPPESQAAEISVAAAEEAAGGTPESDSATDSSISKEIDELLDRIEDRGATLKSFQADMLFKSEQLLVDTMTVRRGAMYYQTRGNKVRFRIHFSDNQEIDLEEDEAAPVVKFNEDFTFDGRWAVRRNDRTKTLERWEIAKQEADRESFRLGKGPFPLPFAIKKIDVLREFVVTLATPDPCDPPNTTRLHLLPKEDGEFAERYVAVDLWVSDRNAIPVKLRYETTGSNEEITTVLWSRIKLDRPLDDKVFNLQPAGRNWTTEVHPLEEPQSD